MATLSHSAKAEKPKEKRSRSWGTIVYEESVLPDYLSIIERSGVQAVVSPLHDKDELEDGSGLKKPHRHILFQFGSQKSRSQVLELVGSFGGVGAELILSMPGSVQYLWHGNSPDKAQYEMSDCVCVNGFDIGKHLPKVDRDEGFLRVVAFIESNDLFYYSDLILAVSKDAPELVPCCRKDGYSIVNYLKAREARFFSERDRARREAQQRWHEERERSTPVSPWRKVPRDFEF